MNDLNGGLVFIVRQEEGSPFVVEITPWQLVGRPCCGHVA